MTTKERIIRLLKDESFTLEEIGDLLKHDAKKMRGLGVTLGLMVRANTLTKDAAGRFTANEDALDRLRSPRHEVVPQLKKTVNQRRKENDSCESIEESLKRVPSPDLTVRRTLSELHKESVKHALEPNPIPRPAGKKHSSGKRRKTSS